MMLRIPLCRDLTRVTPVTGALVRSVIHFHIPSFRANRLRQIVIHLLPVIRWLLDVDQLDEYIELR